MTEIVILDYQIGNVFSVARAVEKIGAIPRLTGDVQEIVKADRVILPGVGAFGRALDRLRSLGLDEALTRYVERERPLLGICVGAQALLEIGREFGEHRGLGLIPGEVAMLPDLDAFGGPLMRPHIAWSPVEPCADEEGPKRWAASAFWGVENGANDMYFVHSYALQPSDQRHVVAETVYGGRRVAAAVGRDALLGVQFHPERSGPVGLEFLSRWAELS